MTKRPKNRLPATELILWKNGNLMAFDRKGNQIPEVQKGGPFNIQGYLKHIRKCARAGWVVSHANERIGVEWPAGGLGNLVSDVAPNLRGTHK